MIIRFKRGQNGNYSWEIEIDKARETIEEIKAVNSELLKIWGD